MQIRFSFKARANNQVFYDFYDLITTDHLSQATGRSPNERPRRPFGRPVADQSPRRPAARAAAARAAAAHAAEAYAAVARAATAHAIAAHDGASRATEARATAARAAATRATAARAAAIPLARVAAARAAAARASVANAAIARAIAAREFEARPTGAHAVARLCCHDTCRAACGNNVRQAQLAAASVEQPQTKSGRTSLARLICGRLINKT